jgi:heme O synthase-like polyprenyltransferase
VITKRLPVASFSIGELTKLFTISKKETIPMNINTSENHKSNKKIEIVSYLISALALVVIILTLTEIGFPLLSEYTSAFYILWIIGFAMSALAGIRDNPDGNFTMTKTVMIALMILGFLTLPLLIVVFFKIPLGQVKDLFIVLSAIIILKWVIVHLYNFTEKYRAENSINQ